MSNEISDEARKLFADLDLREKYKSENLPIIQRHMTAYAKQEVEKALAEVKCYNCGELAVRL